MADSRLQYKRVLDVNVEVKQWEYEVLKTKILIIRVERKFCFFIKEIALALEYADPKDPIKDLIDSEDKKTIKELLGPNFLTILKENYQGVGIFPTPSIFRNLQPHQILSNELGLYSFCTRSRKPKAKPLQRWVFNTVAEIRETGFYSLPGGSVDNPLSLINKVTSLEKEIKTLKETKRICDKETQTLKSVIVLDGSFKDLEERIVKFFKKTKSSFKKTIEEARLDLEKSIGGARLDLEKSIEEARLNLEKSIRKISSSSSSSHSSHRLYYSDSD